MRRLLSVLIILVAAAVAVPAAPAAAGGWAVSTLDELPAPTPGQPVEVGWTVRQHGRTPVDLDEGDVGIVVRSPAGEQFFAGRRVGPTGHYVADVRFPDAGPATWSVRQGWFAEHDLGPVPSLEAASVAGGATVGTSAPAGVGGGAVGQHGSADGGGSAVLRIGVPLLAALLLAAVVGQTVVFRRRSSRPAAPA